MRYKVFMTTEYGDSDAYYCDRKDQAHMLFNMATDSKWFSYVSLSETVETDSLVREWSEGDGDSNG